MGWRIKNVQAPELGDTVDSAYLAQLENDLGHTIYPINSITFPNTNMRDNDTRTCTAEELKSFWPNSALYLEPQKANWLCLPGMLPNFDNGNWKVTVNFKTDKPKTLYANMFCNEDDYVTYCVFEFRPDTLLPESQSVDIEIFYEENLAF